MTIPNERVMVVTAHPDDPEFLAGGTIAKLAREGREITYVIVTNGNKGSGDRTITSERLAPIREQEQRGAARVLGVERVIADTIELKLTAIRCHASQVGDFKAVEARVRARSTSLGQAQGYPYAEGFDHIVLPG
jgi:LmbE family N-acetylglucosaminyl deacetylase